MNAHLQQYKTFREFGIFVGQPNRGEVMLTGDTFKHKDAIKSVGFFWNYKIKAWEISADKLNAALENLLPKLTGNAKSAPAQKSSKPAKVVSRSYLEDVEDLVHIDNNISAFEASRALASR